MSEPTINFQVQTHLTQFKVPTELIRKNFKTIQKLIEKQKKQLSTDVTKITKNSNIPAAMKLEMIKKLIKGFESFERKLQVAIQKDEEYRSRLHARLDNLEELTKFTTSNHHHKHQHGDDANDNSANDTDDNDLDDYDDSDVAVGRGLRPNFILGAVGEQVFEDEGGDDDVSPRALGRQRSVLFIDKQLEHGKPKKKRLLLLKPTFDLKDDDKTLDLHNASLINWYRQEANLLLIDYLIKSNFKGHRSVGLELLKSLSVSNPNYMKLIDYDLFDNFNKVFVSIIENHDLSLVISWFEENRTSLKKINSNLEFEINYCKFLSYIEDGKTDEAIKFSQMNLSPAGNKNNYQSSDLSNYDNNLKKLKEIGGLLVYLSISEQKSPTQNDDSEILFSTLLVKQSQRYHDYKKLISNDRWTSLSECFIENFTQLYGISKNYPLFIYLSSGLSSLKTKSCYCNTENTVFVHDREEKFIPTNPLTDKKYRGPNYYYRILGKINNCPVCSPELFKLSRNLPYAQLITSIFNNPFKLPNGNIYPIEKLLAPPDKEDSKSEDLMRSGQVRDPLTQEIFEIDKLIRVYPA